MLVSTQKLRIVGNVPCILVELQFELGLNRRSLDKRNRDLGNVESDTDTLEEKFWQYATALSKPGTGVCH